MNILVLNCGSSTIKFQLIATDRDAMRCDGDCRLARGVIERVGGEAVLTLQTGNNPANHLSEPLRDIRAAVDYIIRWIVSPGSGIETIQNISQIHAVGHRVVHGGERFTHSMLLDEEAIRHIEKLTDLAPLHNSANVRGVRVIQDLLGHNLPQAAVFDTSFHQTLPERAFLYAIPYQYYRRHAVRRYGFHGTSHRYVAARYRSLRNLREEDTNIITLHLGNGCSACNASGVAEFESLVQGRCEADTDDRRWHALSAPDLLPAKEDGCLRPDARRSRPGSGTAMD